MKKYRFVFGTLSYELPTCSSSVSCDALPELRHAARAHDGMDREFAGGFAHITFERRRIVAEGAGIVDKANQCIDVIPCRVSRGVVVELGDDLALAKRKSVAGETPGFQLDGGLKGSNSSMRLLGWLDGLRLWLQGWP